MYDKISRETMTEKYFGCAVQDIAADVILTPIWHLEWFKAYADKVVKEFAGWHRGMTVLYKGKPVTVISSGIGAPLSGDCALALQYTDCERVFFSGSAGAIHEGYNIGDLLAVQQAIIGEAFSRYHRGDIKKDCFGELVLGDKGQAERLKEAAETFASEMKIRAHEGRIFTIDSILGETKEAFDFMKEKGCDAVEMEVSAVLTACGKIGRKAAALIVISDLPLKYRSLYEARDIEEMKLYRSVIKRTPEILFEAAVR